MLLVLSLLGVGVNVRFRRVSRMAVIVGTVLSPMGMAVRLGLPLVRVGVGVLVGMLMLVGVLVLVGVNYIPVPVLMGMDVPVGVGMNVTMLVAAFHCLTSKELPGENVVRPETWCRPLPAREDPGPEGLNGCGR